LAQLDTPVKRAPLLADVRKKSRTAAADAPRMKDTSW
jgi:hypothetical protein